MAAILKKLIIFVPAAAVLFLSSCATMNRLDEFDLYGSRLAVVMRTPPAPRMNVDYDVFISSHNPVYSAISILTNIAKANQAYYAETVMRDALDGANVPRLIRDRSFSACASALNAEQASSRTDADYVLELDISEWGIDARGAWEPVSLRISLSARLYQTFTDENVWRRDFSVKQAASPEMFGLGRVVDDLVTTSVLSQLTQDELRTGFRELAANAARKVARSLESDLEKAHRW
jgi:ABC-type uncharacterized transport system auxiliary subunit